MSSFKSDLRGKKQAYLYIVEFMMIIHRITLNKGYGIGVQDVEMLSW